MISARSALLSLATLLSTAACAGSAAPAAGGAAEPIARPLAGLTGQRIIVAPVPIIRDGDPLGWGATIPRQREWLRTLDAEIAYELGERGLGSAWVFSDDLIPAYERNRSLSPDPNRLSSGPLRGLTRLSGKERIPEPLASQLRTLVAMHDGRFVLLPLEVAFEAAEEGKAGGQARLRLALVDARSTEFRWLGDVRSDVSVTLNPAVAASLAAHLADLIVAR